METEGTRQTECTKNTWWDYAGRIRRALACPVKMLRTGTNGYGRIGENWLTRVYPQNDPLKTLCDDYL